MTETANFRLFEGNNAQFHFSLQLPDGSLLLRSKAYLSRQAAVSSILSVMANSRNRKRYELRSSGKRNFYFLLKARNGRVLGQSPSFPSRRAREKGINTLRQVAKTARIEDRD